MVAFAPVITTHALDVSTVLRRLTEAEQQLRYLRQDVDALTFVGGTLAWTLDGSDATDLHDAAEEVRDEARRVLEAVERLLARVAYGEAPGEKP